MRISKVLSCTLCLIMAACSSSDNVSNRNDDTTPLDPSFNIHDTAFELIHDLAGYKPDQLAGVVPDLAEHIITTAIGFPNVLSNGEFITTDSRFGDVATATDRRQYQCSGGGTIRRIARGISCSLCTVQTNII